MSLEREIQAHHTAMNSPIEAVKALRISTQSADAQLERAFMAAYMNVKGGSPDNAISQARVAAAIRDWKINREIPEWLARACVIAGKEAV